MYQRVDVRNGGLQGIYFRLSDVGHVVGNLPLQVGQVYGVGVCHRNAPHTCST